MAGGSEIKKLQRCLTKMKKQEKQIIDIDEFDQTASIYQLIPASAGRSLSQLKLIIDSIHNNPTEYRKTPISLLISGKQGTRTRARCFLRALGLEYINEMPSHFLQSPANLIYDFFSPLKFYDSHIISDIDSLYSAPLKVIYEIISKGRYSVHNFHDKTTNLVPVYNPIIMTTNREDKIPKYFKEKIGHIIKIDDYLDQQLELVVLQRLRYANISYQEEKVLKLLVSYGHSKLHRIIRILKDAITIMKADSRNILTVEDVKKVMAFA